MAGICRVSLGQYLFAQDSIVLDLTMQCILCPWLCQAPWRLVSTIYSLLPSCGSKPFRHLQFCVCINVKTYNGNEGLIIIINHQIYKMVLEYSFNHFLVLLCNEHKNEKVWIIKFESNSLCVCYLFLVQYHVKLGGVTGHAAPRIHADKAAIIYVVGGQNLSYSLKRSITVSAWWLLTLPNNFSP